MKRTMNIPVFIPHLGCPNDCVFCNQNRISGQHAYPNLQKVEQDIIAAIHTMGQRRDVEIAFFGGSFTGLNRELQRSYLDMAKKIVEDYTLKGIRFSTRPDYMGKSVFQLLADYPITAIELGVQSMDEGVLRESKRFYPLAKVDEAVRRIKEANIECGLQMMLGLPGDTRESLQRTVSKIIALEPDTLRIYPTIVIEDTELADLFRQELYTPLTVEQAVDLAAEIVPQVLEAGIRIIRIGLQANDGFDVDGRVAGPFHPAFGELVQNRVVEKRLEEALEHYVQATQAPVIYLKASGNTYQQCIGHKKAIKEKLVEQSKSYGKQLRYTHDSSIKAHECILSDESSERILMVPL